MCPGQGQGQGGAVNERPAGTDDYVYVDRNRILALLDDPRPKNVAKEKARLGKLFLALAIHLLLVAAFLFSPMMEDFMYLPGVIYLITGFISLIVGEIGRQCNRVKFLQVFLVDVAVSEMFSIAFVFHHLLGFLFLPNLEVVNKVKVGIVGMGVLIMGLHKRLLSATLNLTLYIAILMGS